MMDWKLFWRLYAKTKILDNGCIEWIGYIDKTKLLINIDTIKLNASRVLWEKLISIIPINTTIRRKCDNYKCCNIDHMYLITLQKIITKPIEQHIERFYSKTKQMKNGCLLWRGSKTINGYGVFPMNSKHYVAHRFAYELIHGKIPGKMLIRHMCNTKLCVNVDHLEIGTGRDNCLDTLNSGNMPTSKLNACKVKNIIQLIADGWKQVDIAKKYGVSKVVISAIKVGRTWSHITGIHYEKQSAPLQNYKEKLYSRIIKNGDCMLWTGAQKTSGYGEMWVGGKIMPTHRIAYELEYGQGSIPGGYVLRHLCHNKLCLNLDHLKCGTETENSQDTVLAGNNKTAKLTIKEVKEIKHMLKAGAAPISIAKLYNISRSCVYHIKTGFSWSYVVI